MRNSIMFVLAIHILLYVTVFLDIPILRPCVSFVYLTFLPGFVILHSFGVKFQGIAVESFLSVCISVLFLMFAGLLTDVLYLAVGISAPLSTLPLLITISTLTLVVFVFGLLKKNEGPKELPEFFGFKINKKGVFLCLLSILVLILSIIGAVYDNVFLMLSVITGIAAIFSASVYLRNRITSTYFMFILFTVSLSLVLQTSLISRHIMGWDIFREYQVFVSVSRTETWVPSGIVSSYTSDTILNSLLSITILPTVYSTIMSFDGELIFKIVFPFIFCFVPVILFKTYETQLGKTVALLSVFFFIADPLNLYGLGSLSLMREMIVYLFISATVFCFINRDLSISTRKVLIIAFSAGIAISHYSFAFLYAFLILFVYIAMRLSGKKHEILNLALVFSVVGIVFVWYMYISSPPLNKLIVVFEYIGSRFTQDLLTSQRIDPGMSAISPLSQVMSLNGLIHKVIIYISEFFVAVGIAVLALKPKKISYGHLFRWMGLFAAFLLVICLAVPNIAPVLNFSRYYRFTMVFLAPLFTLGGLIFLGLFAKIWKPSRIKHKFAARNLSLFILVLILVIFFFFRSGFANTIILDYPDSYSLDFNRMKTSPIFGVRFGLYSISNLESDISSARWLSSQTGKSPLVYSEQTIGNSTLIDYAYIKSENIAYLYGQTQLESGAYVYLRSLNIVMGMVSNSSYDNPGAYFNLSDLYPSLSQTNLIYSNGASEVFSAP